MQRYNPKDIEPRWQAKWEADKIYQPDLVSDKAKYIGFAMFNYPSGAGIHIGHGKNFTLPDVVVRAKRQQGYEVYSPVGFDSFGLPAENYAIRTGTPPRETTDKAIATYHKQYQAMGWSMDWSREIDTSQPEYYKWTQWIFTKLFEQGLAYQKESAQWYCPHDKTVLANEQVEGGKCWRCGYQVEKKLLKQWFFKITDYADEILEATDDLDWTESVKTMQKNWIGRSQGAEIDFKVDGHDGNVTVFTTRPDTLYGATFMVLSPEHPLVAEICTQEQRAAIELYQKQAIAKSEVERQETNREKTGVFTGAYAVNPINGAKIPIWIADYVLYGYGTGAIMAVPGHDDRDYEFAQQFDLPIKFVVEPTFGEPQGDDVESEKVFVVLRNPKNKTAVVLDWGQRHKNYGGNMLIGGTVEAGEAHRDAAVREIAEETGYTNVKLVKQAEFRGHGYFHSNAKDINVHGSGVGLLYDLVDETRQHDNLDEGEKNKFTVTWQPIDRVAAVLDDGIHQAMFRYLALGECYHGEGVMVNSGPYDGLTSNEARERIVADLSKQSVGREVTNYKMRDWLISRQRYWGAPIPIVHCPKDGAVAIPEADLPVLLPNLKVFQPGNDGRSPLANVPEFVNTTCPTCGGPAERETDTMDGYACSSWYFLRYIDPHNDKLAWDVELADKWMPIDFYNGGDHAVAHLLYARFFMRFFHKMGLVNTPEPFKQMYYHAKIMAPDGTAFSKTKGNGPDPLKLIAAGYGADSIRTYICFIAPPDMESPWSEDGVPGCYRFLQRIWTLVQEYKDSVESGAAKADMAGGQDVLRAIHPAIKKVDADIHDIKLNTAIAAMMECVNTLFKIKASQGYHARSEWRFALESLLQLVAPFAPHIAEELWHQLGNEDTIHVDHWPAYEDRYLVTDTVTIVVQINGKLRSQLTLSADADEAAAVAAAQADEKIKPHLDGKDIRKTIYVPGKLVNFVV